MICELLIQSGDTLCYPPVVDGVTIEWERQGQPGKLTFEVVVTDSFNFEEGDACRFSVDGKAVFYGFIFEKAKPGKDPNIVKVTVYDQLFYLRNKDTYVYSCKTASEVVKMIAEDVRLNVGVLEDTKHKIVSRVEDNVGLFDIIQNALDETLRAKAEMYVLYDDAGKLMLTNIGNMKLGIILDKDTIGDYDYKSSITDQTYNRIKLAYENSETGTRQIFISQDSANINRWGVLQHYEKIDSSANAKSMADALLKLYNAKSRTLSIKDALGDVRVRGGTMLVVMLDLGDVNVSNYLLVEQVKHTFKNNQHLMDLKVRGGHFVA